MIDNSVMIIEVPALVAAGSRSVEAVIYRGGHHSVTLNQADLEAGMSKRLWRSLSSSSSPPVHIRE